MREFTIILLSYLMGSISWAYFLGKMSNNVDIRAHGSGNAGATNALRVLGKKMGALTLILDVLKGVLAVIIGSSILGFNGRILSSIFVVLGHNWPVFLNFKGGKGVATSFGVLLMLNWKVGIICFFIAAIVVLTTRYVSLGSILTSIAAPIVMYIISPDNKLLFITTLSLGLLCVFRHKANIVRLMEGKENKLGSKI